MVSVNTFVPDHTIEYDISCGLVMYGLYCVEVCSFYIQFAESFITSLLFSMDVYWNCYHIMLQFLNYLFLTQAMGSWKTITMLLLYFLCWVQAHRRYLYAWVKNTKMVSFIVCLGSTFLLLIPMHAFLSWGNFVKKRLVF